MKKRISSIISLVLSVMLVFCTGTVSVNADTETDSVALTQTVQTGVSDGFVSVLENERFTLYYRESDANIALLNKNTGYVWYSNPQTLDAASTGTRIKSQLAFQYYKGLSQIETMDSYDYGINEGNIPEYTVENDVLTVAYKVGDGGFTTDMLPAAVVKETMEKEILSKLSDEDKETVLGKYTLYCRDELDKETYQMVEVSFPSIKKHDLYLFNTATPAFVAEKVYKAFVKAGYSVDDLERYSEQSGTKNNYKEKPFFNAKLQYSLNENGLTVSLDPKTVECSSEYKPTEIEILPYFGAQFKDTQGYMLVPDGSGAVINFNNGKVSVATYKKAIHEVDNITNKKDFDGYRQLTSLPFFGIASNNGSFIASIDSGYEVAGVTAEISGSSTSFNKVSPYFVLYKNDKVSFSGNGLDTILKYAEEIFSDKITVNYIFTDGYTSYSTLAGLYRDHLVDNGILKERELKSNDMNLSFVGTTQVTRKFLGVPYKYMAAYTTLEEAEEILEKLDIKNVDVRLTDFTKGGANPKDVTSLKLQNSVGKSKGISNLYEKTSNAYLSIFAQYQSGAKKNESAVALSEEVAYKLFYNLINGAKETHTYSFLLSSKIFEKHSKKLVKQVDKYNIEAINLRDIGYELNSDMRENYELDRHETRVNAQKYMANLSKEVKLSVDKGSIFALPYINKIWDIPMDSSNYFIEDYAVPFYQMVISGYVNYVTPSINDGSETVHEFLKCVEYGAEPQFTLAYRNLDSVNNYKEDYYGYNYETYVDTVKDLAQRYSKVSKAVSGSNIIRHENFDGKTAVTEYANGVKLYVNYTEADATVEGNIVPACDLLIVK